MSRALLEAGLLAQQHHVPPAGAHLFLVAGIVITGVVLFGVSRWQKRRDAAAAQEESTSPPHSPESTGSAEDE
jgi:hypothetical protein